MNHEPMSTTSASLPLLQHALDSASAFTPERLMDAVRTERGLALEAVPPLCVLDFDGDLSDHLTEEGITSPMTSWACFHTSMRVMTLDGLFCGNAERLIMRSGTCPPQREWASAEPRLCITMPA